jgi:Xaa-Pro aminopeptidase
MADRRTPPKRGFSPAEFETRVARAQAIMRRHELDALLLTTPPNIRYVTGFATQFWESPTRPWFVVVPGEGKPIAVVPEIGASDMAKTWIDDVRSWPAPRPADDGTSLLAEALAQLPRRFGRVGAELGREMALRMPVIQLDDLRDALPGLEIADGSPAIWEARRVKTPAEVEHIRFICQVASDGYAALPSLVRKGETARDACRKLTMEILSRGADAVPFMPGISGPGGVSQIVCGPKDDAMAEGDILFIDTGSFYDGYFCDFDRNYAVGEVADAAKRAQEAVWDATEAGIAAARPGATVEDVWRVMAKFLEDAGSLGNNVGRMGHGLGMQLTEPPSNMPGDTTPIEPGMVLTIEPGMEYAPGKMIVHEENIVVTEDGAVLLTTRAPRELPILS